MNSEICGEMSKILSARMCFAPTDKYFVLSSMPDKSAGYGPVGKGPAGNGLLRRVKEAHPHLLHNLFNDNHEV